MANLHDLLNKTDIGNVTKFELSWSGDILTALARQLGQTEDFLIWRTLFDPKETLGAPSKASSRPGTTTTRNKLSWFAVAREVLAMRKMKETNPQPISNAMI